MYMNAFSNFLLCNCMGLLLYEVELFSPFQMVYINKPYKCSECHRSFASSSGLTVHKKRHQGIYQYSCKVCGKGCSSSMGLTGHMASVHKEGGVNCPVCGKYFTRKDNMSSHVKLQHSDGHGGLDGSQMPTGSSMG